MKDRNYLINAYNGTSTDDGNGEIETYEAWLERQLLSRIEKLEQLSIHSIGSKRPYFKVSRNDYGKPFFFYKPSTEEGRFNCWMPVDEEFEREFNEILKAACASGGEGKGVSEGCTCGSEYVNVSEGQSECPECGFPV